MAKTIPSQEVPPNAIRSFRRIDEPSLEAVNKTDGKVAATIRSVVSPDGKTRSDDVTGTNAQGQPTRNHMVFVRRVRAIRRIALSGMT